MHTMSTVRVSVNRYTEYTKLMTSSGTMRLLTVIQCTCETVRRSLLRH